MEDKLIISKVEDKLFSLLETRLTQLDIPQLLVKKIKIWDVLKIEHIDDKTFGENTSYGPEGIIQEIRNDYFLGSIIGIGDPAGIYVPIAYFIAQLHIDEKFTMELVSGATVPGEYRKQGIFTMFMDAYEEIATQIGCESLVCATNEKNGLFNYLSARGFAKDSTIQDHYGEGEHGFLMSKGL